MILVVNYFIKISLKKFILFSILINLLIAFCISFIMSFLEEGVFDIDFLKNKSLAFIFILTVIIVPIIETFLFQFLIIEICIRFLKKKKEIIAILTSALIFSICHYYNFLYIISIFFLGIVFSSFYILAKKRSDINPFIFLTLIHAINNLLAFIVNDLF